MVFTKVARADEIPAGTMKKVMVGEKEILVVNLAGKFYAMDGRCGHMQGDLSAGTLEGSVVTCPRHGSQYEVTTAKALRGPKIVVRMKGIDLKTYETKVEGPDLQVNY